MTSSRPPQGGEQDPSKKARTPGSFLSTQMKDEIRRVSRNKESPNQPNLHEKEASRVSLLTVVVATIARVEKTKSYSSEMVPEGTFESLLEQLSVCKTILESKNFDSIDEYFNSVTDVIRILDEIDEDIAEAATRAVSETDRLEAELERTKELQRQQAEQLEKMKLLLPLIAKYKEYETLISQIKDSPTRVVPSKNEIISTFDELSPLSQISTTEDLAVKKSLTEVNAILEKFTTLQTQLQESAVLIEQHRAKEKLEKQLTERMADEIGAFDAFLVDTDKLRIDDQTKTELQEQEKMVRAAKNTFDETFSQEAFDAFLTAFNTYKDKVTKAKNKTIKAPAFLSRTVEEEPKLTKKEKGNTTPKQDQASSQEELKEDTSIEGLIGNWDTGYRIEVKGREVFIKNHKIPGTLLRYEDIKKRAGKRSVDFSQAESLKKEVYIALHSGDFSEATNKARALGKELDIIVEEKLSTPKNIVSASHRYTRAINNSAYRNQDFIVATKLNNDIVQAVEQGDIPLAEESANALRRELRNIETKAREEKSTTASSAPQKERVVEPEKTPAEVPDSTRYKGVVRRSGHGLQIEINGEFKDIPRLVTTVMYQYKDASQQNKEGDFTTAKALKETLLQNVSEGKFDDAVRTAQALDKELRKISGESTIDRNNQESLRNAPVGEMISLLTKKRNTPEHIKRQEQSGKDAEAEMFEDLDSWERKWITSGALDAFRQKNSNIPISDDQIASTKKLLQAYFKIIKSTARSTGITSDLIRSAPQNIIICVKILAGIQHDLKSDIKYLVENYKQSSAETFLQKLDGYIQGKEEVISTPSSTPSPLGANAGTLRPKVPTTAPSPDMAQKNFDGQKKILQEADDKFERMLPYLTSELEKKAFRRLSEELQKLKQEISITPTKQLILMFGAKIERYVNELSKKEKFIVAQYGSDVLLAPVSTIPANATIVRSKRLRGTEPKEEEVSSWKARQDVNGWLGDIRNKTKEDSLAELEAKHADMFARDPVLYKHIYGKDSPIRDEKTKEVTSKELEGKTSIKTPKELLEELTQEKARLEERWKKLHNDIANGIAFGNPEGEKKILRARIELLNERIQRYTQIVLSEVAKRPSPYSTGKQVYSPAKDLSLNDKTRAIGRNHEFDENYKPVKINRETLTNEEILALGKEEAQLSGSLYPNHTEGMVSSLTQSEANKVLGTYKVQAGAKETAQVEEEKITQVLESVEEPTLNQEAEKERHTFVNKLSTWLFGYPTTKKYKWGLLAAGLSTFAITTGTAYLAQANKNTIKESRTLADEIKNQPPWRTFINESVPKWFVENFYGSKEKSFDEFIKTSAPSFAITDANPAPKEKIAKLLCRNVYDIEGAGAGLTQEQQEECARIVKNMQEILKAAKAQSGTLYEKDARLFGDLTIREFYEQVRKVAAASDEEEARLRNI